MAFTYTRPPLTQSTSTMVLVGGALLVWQLPGVRAAWSAAVATTPEWLLVVVVPYLLHQLVFWGMSAAFAVVDHTDRPAFIARYRIQSGKRRRPPWPRVARNLAATQLFWSPVMMVLLWGALRLRGWTPTPELPGVLETLLQLAVMGVFSVGWFYASHRFLHRPWWMKRVHRVHHEFRTTAAISSIYAHPVEFVFGNFVTLALGVVVVGPSLPVLYLWTVLALHTVVAHHSGYAVPWLSWSCHHDWHHYRYKECFGTLGLLDRLLGTDEEFRTFEHGETR